MLARSNARSATKSMKSILTRRVYVNDARAEALNALQADLGDCGLSGSTPFASAAATAGSAAASAAAAGAPRARIPLLLLDFTDAQVCELRRALAHRHDVRAVTLLPRDWVALLKTSRNKFIVPDRETDLAALRALEAYEERMDDAAAQRPVTGAPPTVRRSVATMLHLAVRLLPAEAHTRHAARLMHCASCLLSLGTCCSTAVPD
jgi:hypothetical protein